MPIMVRQLRRRFGKPKSRMQARVVPPVAYYQGGVPCLGSIAALVAAAVEMVSVAVAALEPLMATGVVDPKLKVGGSTAPDGPDVMAAVNATLPVKPPAGVSVIVEVFPEVAPGDRVTAVAVMVTPAGTAVVTVTAAVPVALV